MMIYQCTVYCYSPLYGFYESEDSPGFNGRLRFSVVLSTRNSQKAEDSRVVDVLGSLGAQE